MKVLGMTEGDLGRFGKVVCVGLTAHGNTCLCYIPTSETTKPNPSCEEFSRDVFDSYPEAIRYANEVLGLPVSVDQEFPSL